MLKSLIHNCNSFKLFFTKYGQKAYNNSTHSKMSHSYTFARKIFIYRLLYIYLYSYIYLSHPVCHTTWSLPILTKICPNIVNKYST